MGGAEGVIDEKIGHGSQLLAQLRIVLGLALHIADVLQQHDFTVLQGGSLGLGVLADHVGSHDDGLAQKLAQTVGDDLQRQLRLPLALGLAHVGAEDDPCAVVHQILHGRQRGDDTLVAGDLAVLGGDVEVAAAQDPLTLDIYGFNGFLVVVHV